MRIEIVDGANLPQSSGNSRIEEIEDDLDVETCFICNNKPRKTTVIFPNTRKFSDQYIIQKFW